MVKSTSVNPPWDCKVHFCEIKDATKAMNMFKFTFCTEANIVNHNVQSKGSLKY